MAKSRILIVEDEPFVARDIRQQLVELDYESVGDTGRGEEAVSLAEQLRPDLVLMDIHLEGDMDGIAAAQLIHEHCDIPVVFLTAFAGEETLDRAKKSDPFGYIIKPFDERELRTVIEMALYKHAAESQLRRYEERATKAFRAIPDGILISRISDGQVVEVNESFCRLSGWPREELIGHSVLEFNLWDKLAERDAYLEALRQHGRVRDFEAVFHMKSGERRIIALSAELMDQNNEKLVMAITHDITESKQNEDLLRGQKQTLEMIAEGASLEDILDKLLRVMEAQVPEMLGSILLLDADGKHLRHGAAPSLPTEYTNAIDGGAIGPSAGSCGTAAFRLETVIVTDIATDPLWADYRSLALPHGLRACWSTPIFDAQNKLLGTFAMYYRQPGKPTADHERLIEIATQLAAIAISHEREDEALSRSETKFRTLYDSATDGVMLLDERGFFDCNTAALEMYGCASLEEFCSKHPADLSPDLQPGGTDSRTLANQRIAAAMETGNQRFEWVHKRADTGATFPAEVLITAMELDGKRMLQAVVRDITERKRTDDALRVNEDRYRDLIDNAQELITTYDLNGNILSTNESTVQNTGYSREALLKMNLVDLVAPEMGHLVPAYYKALETYGKAHGILRIQTASGETRFWEYDSTVRTEGLDKPIVRGMSLDVTERRAAEKALRASEAQLGVILESTDDGILAVDLKGKILQTNRRFAELWGVPESIITSGDQQALITHALSLVSDPDGFLRKAMELNASQDTVTDLIELTDGRCFERLTAAMLQGKTVVGRVSSFRDITERKRAETELRVKEDRYRDLVDNSQEVISTYDLEGNLLSVNETAVRTTGYPREALLKMNLADLVAPEMRHLLPEYFRTIRTYGKAHGIMQIQTADGETRFWEYDATVRTEGVAAPIVRGMTLDITERLRSEKAMRASESQLQVILESTDDGILAVDHQGKILKTNRRFAELWLVPQPLIDGGDDQALLDHVLAQVSDSVAFLEKVQSLYASDAADLDLIHFKDGRCFERFSSPMLEGSVITGRVWSFRDITARKRSEEALRESEGRFRRIVENIHDALYIDDADGKVIFANDQFLALFGIERAQLPHSDLEDYIAPEWRGALRDRHERRIRGEAVPTHFEYEGLRQDGRRLWLESTVVPLLDDTGRVIGTQAADRDITERKQAEQALIDSNERFALASRATFNVIWDWDIKTNAVWRNDNFQTLFGYSRDEVETSAALWDNFIHPEDVESVKASIQVALQARSEFWADQYRFLRKDGSYATVEDRAIITRDADGHAIRMLGAMQDISERKQSEQALRESKEKLRVIIEHSAQLFYSHTPDNLLTYVSPQVEAFLGTDPEDTNRPWTDFLTDNPINAIGVDLTRKAIETGEIQRPYELELLSLRGRKLWVEVHESPVVEQGKTVAIVGALTDITESKLAHDQLRLQGSALEAAANAIAITDPMGTIQWVNPAFTTLTGYSATEAIGSRPGDLVKSGVHDQAFYVAMWATLNAGEVWKGEITNRRKDGSLYTGEKIITPLKDEYGAITHFTSVEQDITERKLAEASIRLQSGALEAAANAIVITDRQGVIEWANAAFTRMTEYSLAEAIGDRSGDLLRSGEQDDAFYKVMWDTVLAGEVWQGELVNKRKDGSHYYEEMTITPLRNDGGEITHFIAVKQDITERVETDRELHQYTERLEAMREIDAAVLGARSTLELSRGALTRLRHVVPFERAAVVLFDQALAEGTLLAVDQDKPWLPLAGEVRPISDFHDLRELRSAPFLNLPDLSDIQGCIMEELILSQGLRNLVYVPMETEGSLLGFLALSTTTPGALTPKHAEIALDMTDQLVVAIQHLRLKEELELANQDLEAKVEKRTAELTTTVATMEVLEKELVKREADARAANEAKSTFLAAMSHELRTPLIGVTGMLEILGQTQLDVEQRQIAAIIRESSQSLLQIIGDILDFSKIEAGKLELAPQTFSARTLVESVAQIFRSACSAKGLHFLVEIDPAIAPAHVADALRIRQVLNNFMSNAVKFTDRGSVTLRLWRLAALNGHESLAFEVQDTGIGVSPENQAKLFEPFTQAEASTTRRFGGTGLGLVISQRLAKYMGGSLTMQSETGRGTTITLTLDLTIGHAEDIKLEEAPKAMPTRPAPSIEEAIQERSLVLMAEDHPTNRIVLIQQVHRAGYALEVAEDGQEAFEKWQSGRYAVILTDLHMPRMDGYQLTKAVRDWELAHALPRTPILALTANAMGGEAQHCIELGMDDYLIKPVTIPLLASTLHEWMPHVKFDDVPVAVAAMTDASSAPELMPGVDSKVLLDLCGGDAAAAQDILNDFIATTKADLVVLMDALEQKDIPCIVRQAHRIKGSAAMIGARGLADRAAKLEAYAKTEPAEWETMQEHLAGIQEALCALDRAE